MVRLLVRRVHVTFQRNGKVVPGHGTGIRAAFNSNGSFIGDGTYVSGNVGDGIVLNGPNISIGGGVTIGLGLDGTSVHCVRFERDPCMMCTWAVVVKG